MWVKTESGGAVNMERVVEIVVEDLTNSGYTYANYEVEVYFNAEDCTSIATFDTKDEAKACVEEIISVLNGGKKVGYSFSWLKKAEKSNDAPEEKPADKKPVDKFVDDGIAW